MSTRGLPTGPDPCIPYTLRVKCIPLGNWYTLLAIFAYELLMPEVFDTLLTKITQHYSDIETSHKQKILDYQLILHKCKLCTLSKLLESLSYLLESC